MVAGEEPTSTRASQRPNSRDVARLAGVSVGTVSNVLNRPDTVSAETRERVQAAIKELGFVRNRSARHLRMGRSQTVGLLVLDIVGPYFTAVAKGVEQRFADAGYALMLCSSDRQPDLERQHLLHLEEQGVSGVLVVPSSTDLSVLDEVRSRGTSVVVLDQPSPRGNQCSVAVDDVKGGAIAAGHLLEKGHRRIGFVNGPAHIQQGADRREGLRQAVQAAGLDMESTVSEVCVSELSAGAGEEIVSEVMSGSDPPTAIMCINDLVALGVLRGLQVRGLTSPDDVAVVGYDDVEFAAMLAPALTTVRRPKYEFGRYAADLLLNEIEHGAQHLHQQILFQPELVERDSTRGRRNTKK